MVSGEVNKKRIKDAMEEHLRGGKTAKDGDLTNEFLEWYKANIGPLPQYSGRPVGDGGRTLTQSRRVTAQDPEGRFTASKVTRQPSSGTFGFTSTNRQPASGTFSGMPTNI